jgi:thiamine-phosphate pyrophosphorylase
LKCEARAIAKVCREANKPWVLSHNIELVSELKPDGVHLGKSDPPVNEVRLIVGDAVAIGYSAHSVEEIAFAAGLGADYCWYSPVFDTRKGDNVVQGVGLDSVTLANVTAAAIGRDGVPFPVVFLGGITPENAGFIVKRGGTRVAAIGALCGSDNVEKAARAMRESLG